LTETHSCRNKVVPVVYWGRDMILTFSLYSRLGHWASWYLALLMILDQNLDLVISDQNLVDLTGHSYGQELTETQLMRGLQQEEEQLVVWLRLDQ
jgi:predicted oxidoreductase